MKDCYDKGIFDYNNNIYNIIKTFPNIIIKIHNIQYIWKPENYFIITKNTVTL